VGKPLIKLDNVDKIYGNGTVALKGMSLTVGEHEFISLLGPSGCGKSTALKLIAKLSATTGGQITWPQASGEAERQRNREIGFVFQEPTLMPWATVFKNVYLPLRLRGISRRRAAGRVAEAIDLVGLTRFADVYPRELSGGMKMRVSIARAMVTEPKVLLMDEPFAALDEITRFKLNNDLLQMWAHRAWTVIFVTHSVFESVFLSKRIVVMAARPGRVTREITVDTPHPRTAAFRTSSAYAGHCETVSKALQSAMELAPEESEAA